MSSEDYSPEQGRQKQTEITLLRSRISALDWHKQDAEDAYRLGWEQCWHDVLAMIGDEPWLVKLWFLGPPAWEQRS